MAERKAMTRERPSAGRNAGSTRIISVGMKLASVTIALVLVVTIGIYVGLSRYQRENLLHSKEAAASALSRMFVDSCAAAVVFDDEAALKEVLGTLGHNEEVTYASVWRVDGHGKVGQRLAELSRGPVVTVPTEVPSVMRLQRDADRVVLVLPVRDQNQKVVAVAAVAFSLERENQAITDVEKRTLVVSTGVAIGLTVLLMAMTRFAIVLPLSKLVFAAKKMEEGGAGEIDVHTNDEVGQLAHAFRSMAAAISVREERINTRNSDMRLVLDNVGQGFITLDREGTMSHERSRIVDEWFGPAGESMKFWEYVGQFDPSGAVWFELGWSAVIDDMLPLDLCLEQLPRLVHKDTRTFELAYRPIMKADRLDKTIVVITDVTLRIEREQAERTQREMMSIFQRILTDRMAFDEFFEEASSLIDAIVIGDGSDLALLQRQIHTLKGNCALFGIETISSFCHDLESRMNDSPEPIQVQEKDALQRLWKRVSGLHAQLARVGGEGRVELGRDDYESFIGQLRRHADHDALIATFASWQFEPAAKRLELLGEQIRQLGTRLGKAPIEVLCEPTKLRLPPRRWAPFWSAFAHVVRNTVDHGVEKAEVRRLANKPPVATVRLTVAREGMRVVVTIQDDGGGIDWARLAAKAKERGMPHTTRSDLEQALFADGISTSQEVTSTSGRGVGLSAVRETVLELGGNIEIQTELERGTTFRFSLPETMLFEDLLSRAPGQPRSDLPGPPAGAALRLTPLRPGRGSAPN